MKDEPVLTNKEEYPNDDILRKVLKGKFNLYNKLIATLTDEPYNLTYEWRYYNDGHSWLCKIVDKKKTIIWLSVFKGYFIVAFYFSAKLSEGIVNLPISNDIKTTFQESDFIGKIKPLIIKVVDSSLFKDTLQIAFYKKKN